MEYYWVQLILQSSILTFYAWQRYVPFVLYAVEMYNRFIQILVSMFVKHWRSDICKKNLFWCDVNYDRNLLVLYYNFMFNSTIFIIIIIII